MYCTTCKRNPSVAMYSNVCTVMSVNDLHARMGHISPALAKQIIKQGTVRGIELNDSPLLNFCDACIKGKFTHEPIPRQHTSKCAISQGAKVHTDVWGLSPVSTIGGNQWYITFMDDYTCETFTYLM
jgi:hypothetical protein